MWNVKDNLSPFISNCLHFYKKFVPSRFILWYGTAGWQFLELGLDGSTVTLFFPPHIH